MAAVRIEQDRFTHGRLPAVCTRSGAPTEQLARIEATYSPAWIWVLLLFGIVPFFIAYAFTRRRIAGKVPLAPGALDRARRWSRAALAALGALVLAVLVPPLLTLGSPLDRFPALVPVLLGAAAGAMLMSYRLRVRAIWEPEQRCVRLHNVHVGFVEALAQAFEREHGAAGR